MSDNIRVSFFGSSLVSSYWNGAATYYRGIIKALSELGYRVTFYEPDAYDRQKHRDIPDPDWAEVVVYSADGKDGVNKCLESASSADIIVKASGVGVFDELLEAAVPTIKKPGSLAVFWDVDAPVTLDRIHDNPSDPFKRVVSDYDLILTYGGGAPVVSAYKEFGARECIPVYNALDPSTHHPEPPSPDFASDISFMGNRLPDREDRVEEFFLTAAQRLPTHQFLLGGSGWDDKPIPINVRYAGHVYTKDHNAFYGTPRATLSINRDSMAKYGFSPATRVFEAAGAGACLITDEWDGIDTFLEPGREVLIARNGDEVARHLVDLTLERAKEIGNAALSRVLSEHTYSKRAIQLHSLLNGRTSQAGGVKV